MTPDAKLKRRMKFAPKMGRELSAEYLLCQTGGGPRKLSEATLGKLRSELQRLATSSDARVQRFVARMRARYPELA
jgi:hypothetical protein